MKRHSLNAKQGNVHSTYAFNTMSDSTGSPDLKAATDSLSLKIALREFANDGISMLNRPLDWKAADRKKLYYSAAISLGVMALDPWSNKTIGDASAARENSALNLMATPGNGSLYLPLAAFIGWQAYTRNDAQQARLAVGLASSVIWPRLFIQIPKYAFQRENPQEKDVNPYVFHGPLGGFRHDAFPSGHTATAFAAAAYLRGVKPYNKSWPGQAATILAFGTAYQRLRSNEHWLSDVVAGAMLGQACGEFLARRTSALQLSAGPSGARIIIPMGQKSSK
jgi:membrane-associated phospholipid phosphatase